jgi:hypothetical protein
LKPSADKYWSSLIVLNKICIYQAHKLVPATKLRPGIHLEHAWVDTSAISQNWKKALSKNDIPIAPPGVVDDVPPPIVTHTPPETV